MNKFTTTSTSTVDIIFSIIEYVAEHKDQCEMKIEKKGCVTNVNIVATHPKCPRIKKGHVLYSFSF